MFHKKSILLISSILISVILLAYVLLTYKSKLLDFIQNAAVQLRTRRFSSLLLSVLIIITSIPPMIGFTFIVTLTGFIYGFPGGILPAVSGAFLGAIIAFDLIKKYNFARFIKLSSSKQEKYLAIQEAIEQGGFKMIMLIRLSPIPWPITNMMLSILPTITSRQFILVTFISSFKVTLEVWIGSQLADLSNPNLPPSAHRITMITMICSVLILVGVAWWLYRLTMQKVQELGKQQKLSGHTKRGELDDMIPIVIIDKNPSKKEI